MHLGTLRIAFAVAAATLTADAALAQSTVCANLSADLAALGKRGAIYDPYGDAIAKQRAAIDRAQGDYQRQCSTGLFARPSPNCPSMGDRIQAMQANLQKLQQTAPRYATKTDNPDRQRLIALMRQNHCGEPASGILTTSDRPPPGMLFAGPGARTSDAVAPAAPTTFGRIFTLQGPNGPMTYREEPGGRIVALGQTAMIQPIRRDRRSEILTTDPQEDADPDAPSDSDDANAGNLSGTYRTLCVRTCDGYYFPISYAASRNQFSNDADVCHARCPGTETKLYVVKTPGEDGEQSFAAQTGEPYTRLPNALRYRREVVNACTCGRPDPSLMPLASVSQDDFTKDGATKVGDVRPGLPVPDARPLLGEDPETMADIEADFVPRAIEPPSAAVALEPGALRGPTSPKIVRVVGPKFYADR